MMKKYLPKAKDAVNSLHLLKKERVGKPILEPADLSVLENAEYYLQDAEKFSREGKFELAVLSIGYAEGLIDALRFQKGLNPWDSESNSHPS
jgi:diphthine synthase